MLAASLSERSGRKVRISPARRGYPQRWVALARRTRRTRLRMREATRGKPRRADSRNSASSWASRKPIAAHRVLRRQPHAWGGDQRLLRRVRPAGPIKAEYRRYNIEGVARGDDYGALRQALQRRYRRRKKDEAPLPDLLLIDGGKGQLARSGRACSKELEIGLPAVAAVAKGADRRAGQERIFLSGQETASILPPDSKALHLIQRARDEAHRFAISGHRRKRARTRADLDAGGGRRPRPARRRALLRQFGGLQGVLRAGVEDLGARARHRAALAQAIYEHLHPGAG